MRPRVVKRLKIFRQFPKFRLGDNPFRDPLLLPFLRHANLPLKSVQLENDCRKDSLAALGSVRKQLNRLKIGTCEVKSLGKTRVQDHL